MIYSSEAHTDLFDVIAGEQTREEKLEMLSRRNVKSYRAKTYRSGELLECEAFPIWKNRGQWKRAKRHRPTRAAQMIVNQKNTKKRMIRYINVNFSANDIWLTLTYRGWEVPKDEKQAYKDIKNFIERIKYKRKKKGLPQLKYIYVIEWKEERCHHHLIISGGLDRDEVEACWTKGRKQARRLQPDDYGLTGLACYLSKGSKGERRWGHSKNLKYPEPTISERKLSRKKVERLALLETEAKEILEKAYPGYRFLDIEIRFSAVVAGAYVYARMRKERRAGNAKQSAERERRASMAI